MIETSVFSFHCVELTAQLHIPSIVWIVSCRDFGRAVCRCESHSHNQLLEFYEWTLSSPRPALVYT